VGGGSLEGLKEGLKNTGPLRQEVASTKASFSKDYKSVTATIEDLHRGKGEGGSWEICDGFDSMKTVTTASFLFSEERVSCCVLRVVCVVSCGFSSLGSACVQVHLKQLDRLTKIDLASAKVLTACAESKVHPHRHQLHILCVFYLYLYILYYIKTKPKNRHSFRGLCTQESSTWLFWRRACGTSSTSSSSCARPSPDSSKCVIFPHPTRMITVRRV
jgi:hypothetical protein